MPLPRMPSRTRNPNSQMHSPRRSPQTVWYLHGGHEEMQTRPGLILRDADHARVAIACAWTFRGTSRRQLTPTCHEAPSRRPKLPDELSDNQAMQSWVSPALN